MLRKLICMAASAAGMLFHAPAQAHAGLVQCQTKSGHTFRVAGTARDALCGFVHAVEARGHTLGHVGGWRPHGSVPGSLHPMGMAIDICQTGHNHVNCGYDPRSLTTLAHQFGLMSGCEFRRPDCGHFQVAGIRRDRGMRHWYAQAEYHPRRHTAHHHRHYTRSRHHHRRYAPLGRAAIGGSREAAGDQLRTPAL
jgi:hypothetical protein